MFTYAGRVLIPRSLGLKLGLVEASDPSCKAHCNLHKFALGRERSGLQTQVPTFHRAFRPEEAYRGKLVVGGRHILKLQRPIGGATEGALAQTPATACCFYSGGMIRKPRPCPHNLGWVPQKMGVVNFFPPGELPFPRKLHLPPWWKSFCKEHSTGLARLHLGKCLCCRILVCKLCWPYKGARQHRAVSAGLYSGSHLHISHEEGKSLQCTVSCSLPPGEALEKAMEKATNYCNILHTS